MKIKKGFSVRRVADNYMVIATGESRVNFNSMMTLNESGAFLFEKLAEGVRRDELVDALCAEYSVEREVAEKDADEFLDSVRRANLLCEDE
ncbi:MAG: PqqD family protein [Clostridia bacterium]|nr:PqqD family protein [Clostridia bacterium]